MVEYTLQLEPFLGGYAQQFEHVSLNEVDTMALISLALPNGQDGTAVVQALEASDVPNVGASCPCLNGSGTLMRMTQDQFLLCVEDVANSFEMNKDLEQKLAGIAYTTDQTHVWVALDIGGPATLTALERICPVDLDISAFDIGAVARTSMEHLGVIITRITETNFRLFSASSSAGSFLHALETSIENITT